MSGGEDGGGDPGRAYRLKKRFCRSCVLQLLYQADLGGERTVGEEQLDLFWDQLERSGQVPPFKAKPSALRKDIRKLLHCVFDHIDELDAKLEEASSNWRLERMNVIDRNLLRLGLSEILFSPAVPAPVAINEVIELAKEFGDKGSGAFVNGILDRFARSAPTGEDA
jgi:N utilization substance protein B